MESAICALSSSSENCYLVYPLPQKAASSSFNPPSHAPPGSSHVAPTSGEILIFDTIKLEAVNVVEAHRSPLSCIVLNQEGTIMATASDKGTIIRVFSVPDGNKMYQFRRGSMPSKIYSMAFNLTSTLLCVSSATDTIHIFKLAGPHQSDSQTPPQSPDIETSAFHSRRSSRGTESPTESSDTPMDTDMQPLSNRKNNGTFMGLIRRTSQNVGSTFASRVGGYLPKGVAEMWEPTRDFAWIKLPKPAQASSTGGLRSVVAMSSNAPQVMAVTSDGNFYVFNIDLVKGGEGTLTRQYS